MHCSILFASFVASVIALPVPQVGTGLGDVLSGTAQGTNTLLSGGANNAISSAGNSVADVSNSAGDLVTRQLEEFGGEGDGSASADAIADLIPGLLVKRSPEAQVGTGTGDVLSGAAQGTNTVLSGGANNAVNSAGNSAADVSNSAGDLVTRSPEAQVGTGLGDVLSGTAQGTNTVLSGGANNAVNSAGNSVADLSNSAGTLINRSPEAQAGTGAGDVLSGTAEGTNTLESGGANNLVNSAGKSAADVSNSAGDLVN